MRFKILIGLIVGISASVIVINAIGSLLLLYTNTHFIIDPLLSDYAITFLKHELSANEGSLLLLHNKVQTIIDRVPYIKHIEIYHYRPGAITIKIEAQSPLAIAGDRFILNNGCSVENFFFVDALMHGVPRIQIDRNVSILPVSIISSIDKLFNNNFDEKFNIFITKDNAIWLYSTTLNNYVIICDSHSVPGVDMVQKACMSLSIVSQDFESKKKRAQILAADIRFAHQIIVYPIKGRGDNEGRGFCT
jgi:hypothetical protein